MNNSNSAPFYVFDTHSEAEQAIQALAKGGIDVKQLSLVGRGYHTEEHPIGFYTTGDRVKAWGGVGAFWGGIWGLLAAPAVFFLPGLGLLAMAGPLVLTLVGGIEGAVVVGGLSALGAALSRIGVSDDHAIKFETAIKFEKYVLLVHGTDEETTRARRLLIDAKAWKSA